MDMKILFTMMATMLPIYRRNYKTWTLVRGYRLCISKKSPVRGIFYFF